MLRVEKVHDARDHHTPVTALGHILLVAELKHEFVADLGVVLEAEPSFVDAGGEAEVGEGGGDDVEGGTVFAGGLCEWIEEFGDFEEVSWPYRFRVNCMMIHILCGFCIQPWENINGIAPSTLPF